VWVYFRCKTRSSSPDFWLYPYWWFWSQKSRQNSTKTLFNHKDRKCKNCNPNTVGMFRVHNRVIRARFSALPPPMVLRRKKSSKFNWNIFQLYRQEIIRTATQTVWGLLRWCPVPQNSYVMAGNDKNCIPNSVPTFRVQNRIIRARF